jgi:hypothetical protein
MMGKIKNNETGFSIVEIVLVIVIVALIAAVGVLVYKNHHKKPTATTTNISASKPSTSTTTTTTPTPAPTDPYAGWKTASLQYEQISYKYPNDWTVTDKSGASPKSQNACTYPGHDLVTLNSPSGTQVTFHTGQDCFGYGGDTSFGSVPINALGQNLYLAFEAPNDPETPTSPTSACLAQTANPKTEFDFKSKNIFYNGTGSSDPVNLFCYIPYNPSNNQSAVPTFTVSQIENTPDYNTAKLIFESMHY